MTPYKMKTACHTDPVLPSMSLIKQICFPKQYTFSTSATRWGCEHEDIAYAVYITKMEKNIHSFSHTVLGW